MYYILEICLIIVALVIGYRVALWHERRLDD